MGNKTCILVVLGIMIALANPVAGGMKATFAGGPASWSRDAATLRQLMSSRLEDVVAPELTVHLDLHRRVLAGMVQGSALDANRAACIGSCPARGGSYTGRGCQKKYRCG
ncbi:hypothetical protein BS78_06G056400 [Paspalum vaginatum]|nr:hypothetical protein BS78_06G056400 [Paspalum vaginatum]